ncbi:MAG: RNA ligase [Methylohalobius sp.]|nr:RNA ligase [Methylohalobius sp.]
MVDASLALSLLPDALRQRRAQAKTFKDLTYTHYTDDFKHIPRGTFVFDQTVVFGYPHIGRVLALEAGIKAHFKAPFWAEEKINGYNVRITQIQGQVIALTRGGFICPFTTDRLPDLMPLAIFQQHPELVVCAEVAGPDNPYLESSPPFIAKDVQLFVFDLMTQDRIGFLPQREKQVKIQHFGLPAVPLHGYFQPNEATKIAELILKLHRERREGLVFKEDSDRDHRAKYVTGSSCIDDLRVTSDNLLDLPPEYFINRLLRLSLFVEEHALPATAELKQALGGAFLDGLSAAMESYRSTHHVSKRFRCRFRHKESALTLLDHLKHSSRHIQILQHDLYQEDGYFVLEFERIYPALTGMLGDLLAGRMIYD